MPKTRVHTKGQGLSTYSRTKFKLGGRKNNVSALSLSNDQLLDKLVHPNRKRDIIKILQVLDIRGIKFEKEYSEETSETKLTIIDKALETMNA